jgi:hypothetical protein
MVRKRTNGWINDYNKSLSTYVRVAAHYSQRDQLSPCVDRASPNDVDSQASGCIIVKHGKVLAVLLISGMGLPQIVNAVSWSPLVEEHEERLQ